ncbi:Nitrogen regulatory protein [Chlamydiales bacterium STE3]|nr:Nitrogen regulatory protein [Chlamydiales bacterium STE3]
MDLKIKDVAELLNVSATTIRRWLYEGKIPAYRIQGHYRFSRIEIQSWVLNQKLDKEMAPPLENEFSEPLLEDTPQKGGGSKQFSLFRALNKGNVFHQVPGSTKEEVILKATKMLSEKMHLDADVLAELLLDREKLQPTALNNGIAAPHTRDFLLSSHHDVVAFVFPEKQILYGALDGKPVHSLIFLFASDDRRHLQLLAKIAHLSCQEESIRFLQTSPSKEQLLEYIKCWESNIPSPMAE